MYSLQFLPGSQSLFFNAPKISVTSFLCAQKQAKKQNQRNLRKGRLCPWCWLNMQLTTPSITASSAISTWTLILLHRLVSRSKGKLHPCILLWSLQAYCSHLRTHAFTLPQMELFNSSILRGDIELQTQEHQLCLPRSAWAVFLCSCLWQRVNIVISFLKPKHYSACPEGLQCLMGEDCKNEEKCLSNLNASHPHLWWGMARPPSSLPCM